LSDSSDDDEDPEEFVQEKYSARAKQTFTIYNNYPQDDLTVSTEVIEEEQEK
jgi:hypothetical protein